MIDLSDAGCVVFGGGRFSRTDLWAALSGNVVCDVSPAFIAAGSQEGKEQIFNIGSGEGRSILNIVSVIEKRLDTRLMLRFSGARAIDVPKSVLDCQRAAVELGWHSEVALHEGCKQTTAGSAE